LLREVTEVDIDFLQFDYLIDMLLYLALEDGQLVTLPQLLQLQFLHFAKIDFELDEYLLVGGLESFIDILIDVLEFERYLIGDEVAYIFHNFRLSLQC
jgi:hypothetical protein